MPFHKIEYFMKVAECLNFSAAAQQLYVSQPGLSKAISELENELGVKLFTRSTRKVELTEAGLRFYKLSKNYLAQCGSLGQSSTVGALVGSLSISFGNIVDSTYMPLIFADLQENYPGISITTAVSTAENTLQDLRTGKVDIGLVSSFAIKPEPLLRSELLYPSKLQIVVWPGHPLEGKKLIRLEELRDEPFIFFHPSINRGGDMLFALCAAHGFTPKVAEYGTDFRLIYMMVAQRRGIAFKMTSEDLVYYKGLKGIDIDLSQMEDVARKAGAALVWAERTANPAVEVFLETARKYQPKTQDQK